MRFVLRLLLIVALGTLVFGCIATPPLPPPDPLTWQSINVNGPALFVARAIRSEEFKNSTGADYTCRTVNGQRADTSSLREICISNSCGLDRYTLLTETIYQGTVPPQIVLYSEMGEWCDSTYVDGQRFLIAVPAKGHWSASELMDGGADPLVLLDNSGCLGDLDMKPLLVTEGKDIGPFHSKDYLEWRTQWPESALKPCQIRLPKDIEYKALPLSRVIAAWKEQHS